jgi:predicted dehydrogenase
MKFLIAGLGSVGRRHLRNLITLGEQDILLYRTHQSTLSDTGLGDYPVFNDLDSALAACPDAVIISNPTALHLQVAIPAAEAGCHLLLEKPVSDSMYQVEQLQTSVQAGRCKVLVGFQFRFHPGLRHVKELLKEGAIGIPLSARAVYAEYLPDMHPWEDYRWSYSARRDLGGGVILTLCHPFDILRWLLGEVDAVWAFVGRLNKFAIDVEDTAEIGLRFESGVLGSIRLDYNQRPPNHHLEIVGTQGTVRWDNRDNTVCLYRADRNQAAGEHVDDWDIYPVAGGFERNDMFLAEMQHFQAVLQGETEPICSLEDGINALRLALAARRSAEGGNLVHVLSG